jgi:predicted dehydrogenase
MRILIVGLGSIGQRHARNLRALYGDRVELLAYRVRGLPHVITDAMSIEPAADVGQACGIRAFASLDAALAERPVATIVCNPSSLHMATATAALESGSHVLIEKPLSHTLDGVDRIVSLARQRQRIAAVGYQMRFHPVVRRLRQLLSDRAVGAVTAVRSEWHEYLPGAHPYEDYRRSYAARADQGGGVLLCYIHEFDYLQWLFGAPLGVEATASCEARLGLNVEESVVTELHYDMDGRPVRITVDLSFASEPPLRRCIVTGTSGSIVADLLAPSLLLLDREGAVVMEARFDGWQRNTMFIDEMRNFVAAIEGRAAEIVTASEAAVSLRIALAAKASLPAPIEASR